MSRHNIVGCEASFEAPERRLVEFSQAHGSVVMFPRRGPSRIRALLLLAAGAAFALIAAGLLLQRP